MHELCKITVYNKCTNAEELKCLNSLINNVSYKTIDNSRFVDGVLKQIKTCICEAIITAESKNSNCLEEEMEKFAEGSTSHCYRTLKKGEKYIYKIFSPEYYDVVNKYSVNEESGFRWISDDASDYQKRSFLKRYIRFIKQNEVMESVNDSVDENEENIAKPQMVITSKGFAYRINNRYGKTFEEHIMQEGIKYDDNPKGIIVELKYSVGIVKKAAEYIEKYCHNKKYYHGDIKPDNLLIPNNFTLVENIDFDTWINSVIIDQGLQTIYDATTPLFYEHIEACKTIADWQVYDIRALAKTLIYALVGRERNNLNHYMDECKSNNSTVDWIEIFFKIKNCCGENILQAMNKCVSKDYSLAALFVFNELRDCIVRSCSTEIGFNERIIKIKDFIDSLDKVENLLEALIGGNPPAILNESAIRYLGLKRLDAERGDRSLQQCTYKDLIAQGLSCDWVQYVIEKNYYKQEKDDYDKIDRHLIPDIDLGDGKPLAYKFDGKGHPALASPLERVLDKVGNKSLFLTAEGGQGKTTMLRSFWLDFLSGKHNESCLFVDAKMLSSNDGVKAIQKYIGNNENGYGFSLLDAGIKPLLLIDGVNESDAELREKEEKGFCSLVLECRYFIEKKSIRIVIGSRSKDITTIKEDEKKYDNNNDCEFCDTMRYATVCKLNDSQIKHCMGNDFADINDKQPMIDLLHNNMMLHIYMELRASGDKLSESDMKPGRLLDAYFKRCFKARYFKHICKLNNNEREICELIKKVSDNNTYDWNNPIEENIHDKIESYTHTIDFLINNSSKMYFAVNDVTKNRDVRCSLLCELSLLKKVDSGKYTWADEIYQEYFQALSLHNALIHFYSREADFDDVINFHEFCKKSNDNVLQFAGDICSQSKMDYTMTVNNIYMILIDGHRSQEYLDKIINMVNKRNFRDILEEIFERLGNDFGDNSLEKFEVIISVVDYISVIAVLSDDNMPDNVMFIGIEAFSERSNIRSLSISNGVKFILDGAFDGCNNLINIEISSSVIFIGNNVFDGCYGLSSIKVADNNWRYRSSGNCVIETKSKTLIYGCKTSNIPQDESVKNIGEMSFYDCRDLEKIEIPHNIVRIGDLAFAGCRKLMEITIPSKVKSIGSGAFSRCISLQKVEILSSNIIFDDLDGFYVPNEDDKIPVPIFDKFCGPFGSCRLKKLILPKKLYDSFVIEDVFGKYHILNDLFKYIVDRDAEIIFI